MSNFYKRAITGSLFVAVLISATLYCRYSFLLLFMTITAGAVLEFYKLSEHRGIKPQKYLGTILGLFLFIAAFIDATTDYNKLYLIAIGLAGLIFFSELYRKKEKPFANIAWTLTGIIYTALPFSLLNYIVFPDSTTFKPELLIYIFALIWTNDTFAYIFGVSFGKHRLFERISPKKSWEGSIGGGLCTLGIAVAIAYFSNSLNTGDWLIIAGITVIAGSLGDLTESLLKRSIDIKDSGNILPGHGGILDRFDALLLAIPYIFVYLNFKY